MHLDRNLTFINELLQAWIVYIDRKSGLVRWGIFIVYVQVFKFAHILKKKEEEG